MDRDAFFAGVRNAPFDGRLSQLQVDGINAILDEWDRRKLTDLRWLAYMLATTFHETARTMQPIREFGRGKGMRYGTTYYGRGFVQLTWEANYRKASAVVGVDLVAHPDRALELPIAATIMFDGMIKGWFTGHKLADYIDGAKCDYVQARRIVNGTDRAVAIAGYAASFARALTAAAAPGPTVGGRDVPAVIIPPTSAPPQPDDPGPRPAPAPAPKPAAPAGFSYVGLAIAIAVIAAIAGFILFR